MKLTLPYPISANDFMGSFIPKGGKRPIPFVTPEAKAYKRDCGWIAKAAGCAEPTTKPIDIASVVLHPRTIGPKGKATGAMMDLDNVFKVTLDALKGVVYVDDKQIKHIGDVEYGEPTEHGALIVEILEFVPRPAPLFAGFPEDAASREIFSKVVKAPPVAQPALEYGKEPF
jgi:crossover junction endodeoxyribonuclease RusA